MPVTNYYTIDGMIIGEETGGVRTDYLTDALGSVTATVDSSGNILNTYRYKPYGEQLAKTGTASDPKFTHVGSRGYRQTGRKHSSTYIRARHYDSTSGRWTTKDPLGYDRQFNFSFYHYVRSNPTTLIDPEGLRVLIEQQRHACEGEIKDCPSKYQDIADNLCGKLRNSQFDAKLLRKINQCKSSSGITCPNLTSKDIGELVHMCGGCLKVTCNGDLPDTGDKENWPRRRWKPCDDPINCGASGDWKVCPCAVVLCPGKINRGYCGPGTPGRWSCFLANSDISGTLLHEMLHCTGMEHGEKKGYDTCNQVLTCCILGALQEIKELNYCCKRR